VIGGFALSVPEPRAEKSTARIRFADLAALARLPAFRRTLTCWWINGIANGLPAVLFPIVVESFFGLDEAVMFRLLLCYFGAAILGVPLWLSLSRRLGKVRAWRLAILINIAVFSQVLLIDPANVTAFTLICFFSGLTLGADLTLPPSIQADILGDDRQSSGRRRTASAFALWSMATKLALACAVFIAFAGLDIGHGADAEHAPVNILLLYVAIPVGLKCLVMFRLGAIAENRSFRADPAAHGLDERA
jgi:Na+/melibiose symporter-like transporter